MTDIAGIGSAFIAHSAVRTNEPVTERYPSLLEQFIDTAVICTNERGEGGIYELLGIA